MILLPNFCLSLSLEVVALFLFQLDVCIHVFWMSFWVLIFYWEEDHHIRYYIVLYLHLRLCSILFGLYMEPVFFSLIFGLSSLYLNIGLDFVVICPLSRSCRLRIELPTYTLSQVSNMIFTTRTSPVKSMWTACEKPCELNLPWEISCEIKISFWYKKWQRIRSCEICFENFNLKYDLRSIVWNSCSPCETPSEMLVVNLINLTIPSEPSINHVKSQSTMWNHHVIIIN